MPPGGGDSAPSRWASAVEKSRPESPTVLASFLDASNCRPTPCVEPGTRTRGNPDDRKDKPVFQSAKKVMVGVAALAAAALGGSAIADATTSPSTSTTSTSSPGTSSPGTPASGTQKPPASRGPAHGTAAHEDA